jgi:hypothetical protein
MFCIAFTKKRPNSQRKTAYAQSSQIRQIRKKMFEIMTREAASSDLKDLVVKLIPEVIGKQIEKECQGIYPLQNVFIRKVKVIKTPKTDAGKLLEAHGEGAAPAAADTGKKTVREAAETAEKGADVAQQTAEKGEETFKRGVEASRDTAQKGAEVLRSSTEKAAETASRFTDDAVGAARKVTDQSAEQFGRVFTLQAKASEEVANRAQQNLDVMLQTSTVLADGFQSVMREWVSYAQTAMQRNIDGVNSILRARTVQDLVAAQSDLISAEVQLLLNSSVKISETTARVANDAAQRINESTKQQARRSA